MAYRPLDVLPALYESSSDEEAERINFSNTDVDWNLRGLRIPMMTFARLCQPRWIAAHDLNASAWRVESMTDNPGIGLAVGKRQCSCVDRRQWMRYGIGRDPALWAAKAVRAPFDRPPVMHDIRFYRDLPKEAPAAAAASPARPRLSAKRRVDGHDNCRDGTYSDAPSGAATPTARKRRRRQIPDDETDDSTQAESDDEDEAASLLRVRHQVAASTARSQSAEQYRKKPQARPESERAAAGGTAGTEGRCGQRRKSGTPLVAPQAGGGMAVSDTHSDRIHPQWVPVPAHMIPVKRKRRGRPPARPKLVMPPYVAQPPALVSHAPTMESNTLRQGSPRASTALLAAAALAAQPATTSGAPSATAAALTVPRKANAHADSYADGPPAGIPERRASAWVKAKMQPVVRGKGANLQNTAVGATVPGEPSRRPLTQRPPVVLETAMPTPKTMTAAAPKATAGAAAGGTASAQLKARESADGSGSATSGRGRKRSSVAGQAFVCPVEPCAARYRGASGLYYHLRTKHPDYDRALHGVRKHRQNTPM
mmetsp:Transcript_21228/g.55385  ORF Transcript_21228/g.55385 Transcript_21228/m.55385 type:complete len:540 (+) Transcript_21228:56-1675(+)|eukprot:CAMPEP_0182922558 /NCGR_PEP_ID=MMETSP0105_2-20130417/4875_1 /TAXON_ID=81532 ORGANISM="Acanthoeca-like sp., Strain 10tr" /NCGR_SAMPLE_ID=MMETSP0105_2 /ASSEMBLY_ACC=CAM_ASM_000205 /LENGTH=539 /DNA_ID=CAMNT_0025060189 /DNA_START=56 /DNA_END=1675 /DNA_ORIENTATION=-